MTSDPPTFSTVFDASYLVARLNKACAWLGIDRGRATRYGELVMEFFDGKRDSQENVLAYYEGIEIAEIHDLWSLRIKDFPGLQAKFCEAFKSGPLVQENENTTTSSNRPRNDAFGFAIAGRLLAAGCDVLAVDGVNHVSEPGRWFGDVTIRHAGVVLDIQCKRPQTVVALKPNIDKAKKQILRATYPGIGIIAVDASVIIRPRGTLLPARSVASASHRLSTLVQPHAEAVTDAMVGPQVAGLIWFGRIPCMISEPSRITTPRGGKYDIIRPYSAGEIAVALNSSSPHASHLRSICEQLHQWLTSRLY